MLLNWSYLPFVKVTVGFFERTSLSLSMCRSDLTDFGVLDPPPLPENSN